MKSNTRQSHDLPEEIKQHLRQLIGSTGLPETEESLERLAAAWIEKERLFTGQTEALDMPAAEAVPGDDPRGLMLLTSSGSLLSLWPVRDGREMEYASISLRSDVPEILQGSGVELKEPVELGKPVVLENAPIKQTSSVYKIAVCHEELGAEEQEKRIREATIFLTNGFARINRQTKEPESGPVDHFNKQSIVAYIAKRSGLTQKQVQQVVDDYLSMVETGVLLGETVNMGRIGRMSIKRRPPQKARVGRNPSTGEEITIPAKPAMGVPKFSFSSHLKERAAEVELGEEEPGDEERGEDEE
jgi:nucleoid DNA-binding protein